VRAARPIRRVAPLGQHALHAVGLGERERGRRLDTLQTWRRRQPRVRIQGQLFEQAPAVFPGLAGDRRAVEGENVEGHEGHRHVRAQRGRGAGHAHAQLQTVEARARRRAGRGH
jgi:hypothetical protein